MSTATNSTALRRFVLKITSSLYVEIIVHVSRKTFELIRVENIYNRYYLRIYCHDTFEMKKLK